VGLRGVERSGSRNDARSREQIEVLAGNRGLRHRRRRPERPRSRDARRTVGLVYSPYIKRGVVDSTMYSTVSYVRTMELILGLPPMTQYDELATPMYNAFTTEATIAAYVSVAARIDLMARNPAAGEGARRSARLNFSDYDLADFDELNDILWKAIKGDQPMPAPVRSALLGP